MYYTNEFIDDLITQISMAGGDEYVKIQSPNVAKMLDADKLEYKKFGVYWWAVKEGLRTCVHNGEWYCGDIEDSLMKERAWHGDLFQPMRALPNACRNVVNKLYAQADTHGQIRSMTTHFLTKRQVVK